MLIKLSTWGGQIVYKLVVRLSELPSSLKTRNKEITGRFKNTYTGVESGFELLRTLIQLLRELPVKVEVPGIRPQIKNHYLDERLF